MKQVYIRRPPSRQETVLAATLAVGLGTVLGATVYYFARVILARDEVAPLPDSAGLEGLGGGAEDDV